MTTIAFVGLGAMGLRMANRLAQAGGIDLAVFDLNPEQMHQMLGKARLATSIADAAEGADAIFSVVPADRHTRAVVDEYLLCAAAGQTYVDFSTIGPATIEEVGRQLSEVGVQTISAGMTKSITGATEGTLSLFLGGPSELPPKLKPAFDAIATDLMMVGSLGAAKALKLVNNMVVATLDVAITEALTIARQYDIPYQTVTDALALNGADSWPLHNHIVSHVLPNDLGPGFFSTRFLMKDMKLYVNFASSLHLPAAFAGLALAEYRGTAAHGFGDDYHMIVVRWLERGAKVGEREATCTDDASKVLDHVVAGVRAVQALVSAEAVRILGRMGVTPTNAAYYLDSGSAGNDSLREMASVLRGTGAKATIPAEIIRELEGTLAIADAADVPAAVFEIARANALALLDRFGGDVSLWQTVG